MAKKRIAIVTPTRDGLLDMNYALSLFHTAKVLDEYEVEPTLLGGVSDIITGRNKLWNRWYYDTDVEYILWVDSDVSYSPLDLKQLLTYDVEVIGGCYPKKGIEIPRLLKTALTMQKLYGEVDAQKCLWASLSYVTGGQCDIYADTHPLGGLGLVDHIGMGFCLISRSGAKKLMDWAEKNMNPVKWDWYDKEVTGYGVFNPIDEDGQGYGEDYSFCIRLKKAGIPIHFHPKMKLRHSGSAQYDGNFHQVIQLAQDCKDAGIDLENPDYTFERMSESEEDMKPEFED